MLMTEHWQYYRTDVTWNIFNV